MSDDSIVSSCGKEQPSPEAEWQPTCASCQFWRRDDGSPHLGHCSSQKFQIGYNREANTDRDGVAVEGDEGWGFLTGESFGCIHFRALPAAPAAEEEP